MSSLPSAAVSTYEDELERLCLSLIQEKLSHSMGSTEEMCTPQRPHLMRGVRDCLAASALWWVAAIVLHIFLLSSLYDDAE